MVRGRGLAQDRLKLVNVVGERSLTNEAQKRNFKGLHQKILIWTTPHVPSLIRLKSL